MSTSAVANDTSEGDPTWEESSITYICASSGSCAFATGDLNVVMQKSADGVKTCSAVWPGDTTGLSALAPTDVVASWGSDYPGISGNQDEIYAANIGATLP